MAINYATTHAAQIDERFAAESITEAMVNRDYDFTGVKTVVVHSVPTVAMNDYKRTGANRYGEPAELEDSAQEMTMSQDKSFTFTVDKGNSEDDAALNAGKALNRQVTEVVIPMVDSYRLQVMAGNAKHKAYGAVTKSNAYEGFLDLNTAISEDKVPLKGRAAIVSGAYYKYLKLDPSFVRNSDLGQQMLINGQVGTVDGVPIVLNTGVLPEGVELIIAHPSATCAPHKLAEYKLHQDPPGLSGALVEGRDYFDAFVLNEKKCAIAVRYSTDAPTEAANDEGDAE